MYNEQRGVIATEHNCKVKTEITIDSEKYNQDKAYGESIDNKLNQLFSSDLNPTK